MRKIAAITALVALHSCGAEPEIRPGGYLKTSAKDRIFTCRLSEDTTLETFKFYAEKAANTEGQMTAVYCYAPDATMPVDAITEAPGIPQANQILHLPSLSAWRFAFMRYRNGQTELVDCTSKTESSLCR